MKALLPLLFVVLANINCFGKENMLNYHLSFKPVEHTLTITSTFKIDSESFRLIFPEKYANCDSLFSEFYDIKAIGSGNKIIPTERPNEFTALTKDSIFSFQYSVRLAFENIPYSDFYKPFQEGNWIQIIGETIFAVPYGVEDAKIVISTGNMPDTWHFSSTLQKTIQSKNELTTNKVSLLKQSFFVFTKSLPEVINIPTNGRQDPVLLLISPDIRNKDSFVTLVKQSMVAVRRFWEQSDSLYIISVSALDSLDQGVRYRATCFPNGIVVGVTNNIDKSSLLAHYLFAHELTHNWIGIKFPTPEPEEDYYWLSEGFTDFIAWNILLTQGWVNEKEYISHYNKVIQSIYLSKFRNASASTISQNFWTSNEARKIPYNKGCLFALLINYKINAYTGKSIQAPLMQLITESKKPKFVMTDSAIAAAFYSYLGSRLFETGKVNYFDKGMDIDLDSVFTKWGYKIITKQIGDFDLGFTWNDTTGIISNVSVPSAAYDAGIRTGGKVIGHSVYYNRIDKPANFKIRYKGQTKSISYYPESKAKVIIPQFVPI